MWLDMMGEQSHTLHVSNVTVGDTIPITVQITMATVDKVEMVEGTHNNCRLVMKLGKITS